MLISNKKRWISLWIAAFATALVSVTWKLFVPSMASYPFWIDYVGVSVIFLAVLFLPKQSVASARDHFQKAHFNTPFTVSVGLFVIVCLAGLVSICTKAVHPENWALALSVVFLLFIGPAAEKDLSRLTNLTLPFLFTLGVTVSLSFLLPGLQSDVHFAGALTCVYAAWLFASVLERDRTYVRDNWFRAILPPAVHAVFLGIAVAIWLREMLPQMLSEWLHYMSHYSSLPATEQGPAIAISMVIPLFNAALIVLAFWLVGRRSGQLDFQKLFIPIVWSLLTVVGLLSFLGVLPSSNSVFPLPFQSPASAIPMAIAVRAIGSTASEDPA